MDIDTDSETLSRSAHGVGVDDILSNRRIDSVVVDKMRAAREACVSGQLSSALRIYTEALPHSNDSGHLHILLANRSAVLTQLGRYELALQDAIRATQLASNWPKTYYRQAVALQCLGRWDDAMSVLCQGLTIEPHSSQLLSTLVDTVMKSPLKSSLESTYSQLQTMHLDKSPFVVMSVAGQELLAAGSYVAAVTVLEAALQVGTNSQQLRGSVFSALSSAYWAMNSLDKAMGYMQQDLSVARSLGDTVGECRAHGNLGSAHFSKGQLKEALTSHRYQLVLAMKSKDMTAAASALTSLGHVYTAIGELPNALSSHKQCVQLLRQLGRPLLEAREIGNVGAVYLALGEFDSAVECHQQHLRFAQELNDFVEEARAYSNLGSVYHQRRQYDRAVSYHSRVLEIAQRLGDRVIEARAYAGLGHAARCGGDLTRARRYHEKQLELALRCRDAAAEGRACANLGIVYQLCGDHDAALKLHQAHLDIARRLHDRGAMGRAYGNIGNAYSAMGYYEQAIKYHKQELGISKEVNDRSSEAATHGNLAVSYQALGQHDTALLHYRSHLNIARELKDVAAEACALCNLGNCYSGARQFNQAIPYYEQFLMLAQELHSVESEARACHFLGYAHYCVGHYREAVHYYQQDLSLAQHLDDSASVARAYCNLGLSQLALGNHQLALESQQKFFVVANQQQHIVGMMRALANTADVLVRAARPREAVEQLRRRLGLAKRCGDRQLLAAAYQTLGGVHRSLSELDKALAYYTQELTVRQEMGDVRGECGTHASMGGVHILLANYTTAIKCYNEQLDRANELGDARLKAQALGNLGAARLNMYAFDDALRHFQQQLAALQQAAAEHHQLPSGANSSPAASASNSFNGRCDILSDDHTSKSTLIPADVNVLHEKIQCLSNLSTCCERSGQWRRAVGFYEHYLQLVASAQLPAPTAARHQLLAYRGLAASHQQLGQLQPALVCCEKRLLVAHELAIEADKAAVYGQLAELHCKLANYEQALSCLDHQLNIARDLHDGRAEAAAASGLGRVHRLLQQPETARHYHQMALRVARAGQHNQAAVHALGQLAADCEAAGQPAAAVDFLQQQLAAVQQLQLLANDEDEAVASINDDERTANSSSIEEEHGECLISLARLLALAAQEDEAHTYLLNALALCQRVGGGQWRQQVEGRVRQQLGQLLWRRRQLPEAREQLQQAVQLLELVRRQPAAAAAGELWQLQLFDVQTAAYQALECVLVELGFTDEALLAVERSRCRALADLQQKRNINNNNNNINNNNINSGGGIVSVEQLSEAVRRQAASVLYFSLTAGRCVHAWLVTPQRGQVYFHRVQLTPPDEDEDSNANTSSPKTSAIAAKDERSSSDLLADYVTSLQAALGLDAGDECDPSTDVAGAGGTSNTWQQHLHEVSGGRVSSTDADKTGFLRMVSRSHAFNSSSYSLSSMFSAFSCSIAAGGGSIVGGASSRAGSTRSRRALWAGPRALQTLYEQLLAPLEQHMSTPSSSSSSSNGGGVCQRDLVLVLDGPLYLVPFAVMKRTDGSGSGGRYLCERYNLMLAPTISSFIASLPSAGVALSGRTSISFNGRFDASATPAGSSEGCSGGEAALVVGNPRVPAALASERGWADIRPAENEAAVVAGMLGTAAVTGAAATKHHVLQRLCAAECVHLAVHVSWKLAAVVLAPAACVGRSPDASLSDGESDVDADAHSSPPPPLSEVLVTAADILQLRVRAKLVVLSSCHTPAPAGTATVDGVVALSQALLAAGAGCVVYSLWPVADTAVKILYRAFYSALLQGARVSRALNDAMQTVHNTKHCSHPANWAGYCIVGADVRLTDKVAQLGQALAQLLATPPACRDALRVCLHLVEKSLQRIARGHRNAMYTTQKSISNKVGAVSGWRQLLMAVGFRFEPAANGIASAVFFPQSDASGRLTQCSACLQALLALSLDALTALSQLAVAHQRRSSSCSSSSAAAVIAVVRHIQSQLATENAGGCVTVAVGAQLWRTPGCHELLAAIGLDLTEVTDNDQVLLSSTKASAVKRNVQFTLQALLALFDTQEAPKSLCFESSSSVESSDEDDAKNKNKNKDSGGENTQASHKKSDASNSRTNATLPCSDNVGTSTTSDAEHESSPMLMGGGAFRSYVRARGEPDGARCSTLLPSQTGRANAATATPPPVPSSSPPPLLAPPPAANLMLCQSPRPTPRLSLASSGKSSAHASASGVAALVVDKLSVRAAVSSSGVSNVSAASPIQSQYNNFSNHTHHHHHGINSQQATAGDFRRRCVSSPPSASDASAAASSSLVVGSAGSTAQPPPAPLVASVQDHIIATQMSRLRELAIVGGGSDESSANFPAKAGDQFAAGAGTGAALELAPSLSTLLFNGGGRGDTSMNKSGATAPKSSVTAAEIHRDNVCSVVTGKARSCDRITAAPAVVNWSCVGMTSTAPAGCKQQLPPRQDDADGRSMTDSNYSSYSPSYQSPPPPPPPLTRQSVTSKKAAAAAAGGCQGFSNLAYECDAAISVSARQRSDQIAEYMDELLGGATAPHHPHRSVTSRGGADTWTAPHSSTARRHLSQSLHPAAEC